MAIARRHWTSRQPNWTPDGRKSRLFIHHTVTSGQPRTRAGELRHMRELEQMHLNRGFTGVGYHFVLFPSGRLYEGRPSWSIPAAQGGDNTGTVAIAYVSNTDTEKVTRRAKLRLVVAARSVKRRKGVTGLGGHRDSNTTTATACPGKNLHAWLPKLASLAGLNLIRK
jgi:hypothetical protein